MPVDRTNTNNKPTKRNFTNKSYPSLVCLIRLTTWIELDLNSTEGCAKICEDLSMSANLPSSNSCFWDLLYDFNNGTLSVVLDKFITAAFTPLHGSAESFAMPRSLSTPFKFTVVSHRDVEKALNGIKFGRLRGLVEFRHSLLSGLLRVCYL